MKRQEDKGVYVQAAIPDNLPEYIQSFYQLDSGDVLHMKDRHPDRLKYSASKLSGRALNRMGEPFSALYTIRFENRLYEVTTEQIKACIAGVNPGFIPFKCDQRKPFNPDFLNVKQYLHTFNASGVSL